jgi:hypothetical protein
MVFNAMAKWSVMGIAIVGFLKMTEDTIVETFLRWIWLGGILDFVYTGFAVITAIFVVMLLTARIRNWMVLGVIGLLVYFFVQYAL